jgi:hypothetical protein
MTPQEKELIQGVFDRLSRAGVGTKDSEAEALIYDGIQRHPDAAYGLVQAVIMQEMGLNHATQRINELQRQLDEVRAAAPAGGGSFLGTASPWGGGSVPRTGQVAPQAPANAPPPQGYAPQPAYAPPTAAGPWSQPQASGAGSFLRNAATMAAGVAGGSLIAQGLSSMFGGHQFGGGFGGFGGGLAGGSPWGANPGGSVENVTVNNYYGDQGQDQGQDPGRDYTQDAGVQDASYYDGSGDGGFDGGFDGSSDV